MPRIGLTTPAESGSGVSEPATSGLGLASAFAESVLHDEVPTDGHFWVPPEALTSRFVATFNGPTLRLANMTGSMLKRSGAGPELTTEMPYATPQRWALAIYKHPGNFDGILYVSRHATPELAVVVFDRAKPKLQKPTYTPLGEFPGSLKVAVGYGVLASSRTWRAV